MAFVVVLFVDTGPGKSVIPALYGAVLYHRKVPLTMALLLLFSKASQRRSVESFIPQAASGPDIIS
jgi:hypothetical protein